MKVTVVAFTSSEARKARVGLTKLDKGILAFKKDLEDQRVDADDIRSFVDGIRLMADYFEKFLDDDRCRR